ncbi:HDOD domain-containing protein [Halomonadaceae bacterium KBTZ08]
MAEPDVTRPPTRGSANDWVQYLSQVEMPVLAETLREISQLTDSDSSTVNQLADVILKDADLTSQVLRLSNTVFYNRSRVSVSTVSRAITLIGFDAVRAMAISTLVIDALLSRNPRTHLLRCLARSLHAAVQARSLLPVRSAEKKEEAFVAALLSHIGELAFWACRIPQADELDRKMNQMDPVEAQKEVIGASFVSITRGLVAIWSLGPLVKEVVSSGKANSAASALVRHSLTLAEASERGWHDRQVEQVVAKLAGSLNETKEDLLQKVQDNSHEAAEVAVSYGMPQVTALLPDRDDDGTSSEGHLDSQGDPMLQLQILRELSELLVDKPDLNLVFQTVVEGMHRAIGLQRVVLLMRDRKGQHLITRKVLGEGTAHWRDEFIIDMQGRDLLARAATAGESVFLSAPDEKPWKHYERPGFDRHIGRRTGLFGPLMVGERVVGLFYADNSDLYQPPDREQFQAFSHFVQQAQLCLNNLSETS